MMSTDSCNQFFNRAQNILQNHSFTTISAPRLNSISISPKYHLKFSLAYQNLFSLGPVKQTAQPCTITCLPPTSSPNLRGKLANTKGGVSQARVELPRVEESSYSLCTVSPPPTMLWSSVSLSKLTLDISPKRLCYGFRHEHTQ
jgi:hypothetical protein